MSKMVHVDFRWIKETERERLERIVLGDRRLVELWRDHGRPVKRGC